MLGPQRQDRRWRVKLCIEFRDADHAREWVERFIAASDACHGLSEDADDDLSESWRDNAKLLRDLALRIDSIIAGRQGDSR